MGKAKKVLMFAGAVTAVLVFAPIALAFVDKLTGGAAGSIIDQIQSTTAGTLGVSATSGVEGGGARIIAD